MHSNKMYFGHILLFGDMFRSLRRPSLRYHRRI